MYLLCLVAVTIATLVARLLYLDWYPFGFSQHVIVHATLRRRLYETIFIKEWDSQTWTTISDIVIRDQHGPQSLIEALLTPIFGFGFTESRLLISLLGLVSMFFIIAWGTVAVNRWFGLFAGLTIGLAPYALYFSRYGDSEHVNIYLQGFFLLYAAQRSIQRGYSRDYALFGAATALSLYVYATNQLLCLVVLGLFALFQVVPLLRSGWRSCGARVLAFCGAALLIGKPMIEQHLRSGRNLLLRTPYGTPNYEFSKIEEISMRIGRLWNELFVRGGDPWFARSHGAINDYTLLLVIPGCITMGMWLRRGLAAQSRSIYFMCAVATAFVLFGGLPAVLSPEQVFRRAVVLAIGLDMLKAVGCYGLALFALRYTPRAVSFGLIAALMIAYGSYNWRSFLYGSFASDSASSNSIVGSVRYVRDLVRENKEAVVLLPTGPGYLSKEAFSYFLDFHLGYPKELPTNLKIIDLPDLESGPLSDVIVPFPSSRQIVANSTALPSGIVATNVRPVSNRLGEMFAVVDFTRAGQ